MFPIDMLLKHLDYVIQLGNFLENDFWTPPGSVLVYDFWTPCPPLLTILYMTIYFSENLLLFIFLLFRVRLG